MATAFCDECRKRAATIFLTKIVNNQTFKQRLCETCARQHGAGAAWVQSLAGQVPEWNSLPLDQIMMDIFNTLDTDDESFHLAESEDETSENFDDDDAEEAEDTDLMPPALLSGVFSADEDALEEMDADEDQDGEANDPFAEIRASREVPALRCPKCGTTWDRLRQEGRAGCAQCYSVFGSQLSEVLERVQRSAQHIGKQPRAAEKRRRRLEHLRARRDHRLEMLQRRLQEAVAAEKYEDAARLRDKIKMVSSTIVSDQ